MGLAKRRQLQRPCKSSVDRAGLTWALRTSSVARPLATTYSAIPTRNALLCLTASVLRFQTIRLAVSDEKASTLPAYLHRGQEMASGSSVSCDVHTRSAIDLNLAANSLQQIISSVLEAGSPWRGHSRRLLPAGKHILEEPFSRRTPNAQLHRSFILYRRWCIGCDAVSEWAAANGAPFMRQQHDVHEQKGVRSQRQNSG